MVSKLRCDEKESCFEDIHSRGAGHGVEVLQLDFRHQVVVDFEGDLENVALLGLDQEEKHGLGFVGGGADEKHSSVRVIQVVSPPGDGAANINL